MEEKNLTKNVTTKHRNDDHIGLSCKDCGAKFTSKSNLNNHISERKFVSCKECDSILCNLRALSNHHMNTHRNSQCDVCHKFFPRDRLKYHKLNDHDHKH